MPSYIQRRTLSFASHRSSSEHVGPSGQWRIMWSMVWGDSPQGQSALVTYLHFWRLSPVFLTLDLALFRVDHSFQPRDVPRGRSSLGSGRASLVQQESCSFHLSSLQVAGSRSSRPSTAMKLFLDFSHRFVPWYPWRGCDSSNYVITDMPTLMISRHRKMT